MPKGSMAKNVLEPDVIVRPFEIKEDNKFIIQFEPKISESQKITDIRKRATLNQAP